MSACLFVCEVVCVVGCLCCVFLSVQVCSFASLCVCLVALRWIVLRCVVLLLCVFVLFG